MYLIGLTGNIACGKTTAVQMLEELGAQVCDADQVARQVSEPGGPAYQAIVEAFGAAILTSPGGPIDRRALGRIVFADRAALKRLEQITHPIIRREIESWLATRRHSGTRVAVIDAIKLIESSWAQRCDAVWVVTCRPEQQLERLTQRRGMSADEARQRIAAQGPQADKVAVADINIDNSGDLVHMRQQITAAWLAIPGQQ